MFRHFLYDNLLKKLISSKKQYINYFQIGCYPSSDKNLNHELPLSLHNVYKKYSKIILINLVLIDQEYEDKYENRLNNIKNLGINVYIYPKRISNEEYNTLIEFNHIINYYNHLGIIMEFTSIIRPHYYKKENITEKLFITESNCLVNTNEILFNPLFKIKYNQLLFKRYENEDNLHQYYFLNNNEEKLYIEKIILNRFLNIEKFYIKVLSYMNVPIKYDDKLIENNYIKNYKFYNYLLEKLLYRLNNCSELNNLIQEFKNSNYLNLENYINTIIFNHLLDLAKIKGIDDIQKICFTNLEELKKKSSYFINILG